MASEETAMAASDAYDAEAERLDLTGGMHAGSVRQIVIILAVAFVTIALFNAQGFGKWSEKLPDNSLSEFVIIQSFLWQDWMTALGTAAIFAALRDAFQGFRETVCQLWPPQQ